MIYRNIPPVVLPLAGVHRLHLPGVRPRVVPVRAGPRRPRDEGVRAVLQGAGRRGGRHLQVLLPAERDAPRRAGHVRQAGHAVQRLQRVLRRLSKVPRGELELETLELEEL